MDANFIFLFKELIPVLVTTVIFGVPLVAFWVTRHFRFLEKQLELNRDQRLVTLEHERALLQAELNHATSELEFLRKLAVPVTQVRVANPVRLPTAPSADQEQGLGEDEDVAARKA